MSTTPRPALKATGVRRRYACCLETELAAAKAECERLKFATEGHLLKTIQQQAELARLRADLERFTGHGLLDCHAICDQRDAAIARAERAEADRNEFFRDTARLDWLLQDNVVRFDTSYHDRAAIDAAMKEDSR